MLTELFGYILKLILNYYFKFERNLSWILLPQELPLYRQISDLRLRMYLYAKDAILLWMSSFCVQIYIGKWTWKELREIVYLYHKLKNKIRLEIIRI